MSEKEGEAKRTKAKKSRVGMGKWDSSFETQSEALKLKNLQKVERVLSRGNDYSKQTEIMRKFCCFIVFILEVFILL